MIFTYIFIWSIVGGCFEDFEKKTQELDHKKKVDLTNKYVHTVK